MQVLREDLKLYVAKSPSFESISIAISREDISWIIAQLPEKPKTIALLFSSSIHGWKLADWKARCIGNSQTITLLKSTKGKTAGGYLHIQWKNEGGLAKDDKCFLFSLD
jgi:hypothetical protein